MSTPVAAPAPPWAGARAAGALRTALDRFTKPGPHTSAWRVRAPLIGALSVVLVAGTAVLVTYHGFYDARLRALETTRAELATRRDEAIAAAEKVKQTELRLRTVEKDLESFNRDVLGTRKERLAVLIEDVYGLTQKAGLVPGQIAYSLDEATSGVDRLALSFAVQGRYADVKRLLFSFENNPRFLLLESVGVATDDREPDVLRLNLVVTHYFRPEATATRHVARAGASRPPEVRPTSAPAKTRPDAGVPE